MSLKSKGFKKLQAAKALDVDVKTVRKYWDMTEKDYLAYVKDCSQRHRCMAVYDNFIVERLERYPDVSSAQLYDWLRESYKDFKPSYASVRLHIQRLRERESIMKAARLRQYRAVEDLLCV